MSRPKKAYPPGTFIPTPQRLIAITQLCISFSLILWFMFQPFMGEYFTLRSRMLLYEYAMGNSDILKGRDDQEEKLRENNERFEGLPFSEKRILTNDYSQIKAYAQRSVFQKMGDGLHAFLLEIPPLEQAWIFFSITIALLILLKVEGARQAAWLLPLIAAAYVLDNFTEGNPPYRAPDYPLFPTEEILVSTYLSEPLSSYPSQQRQQLEKGWERYLIDQWATQDNFQKSETKMLRDAEFNFTVARLLSYHAEPMKKWLRPYHEKSHPLLLGCYILWNSWFAWMVSRPLVKKESAHSIDLKAH